jgi:hypothetical protein
VEYRDQRDAPGRAHPRLRVDPAPRPQPTLLSLAVVVTTAACLAYSPSVRTQLLPML